MVRSFHIILKSDAHSFIDVPHILPVLFSFTTPAKFCFRAIASFSRFVTGMTPSQIRHATSIPRVDSLFRGQSLFAGFKVPSPRPEKTTVIQAHEETAIVVVEEPQSQDEMSPRSSRKSVKRAVSFQMSRVSSIFRGQPSFPGDSNSPPESPVAGASTSPRSAVSDVGGPRFQTSPPIDPMDERTAGDPAVYNDITV